MRFMAITLCIFLSGCSVLAPWDQKVTFLSDPPNAEVSVDGEPASGTTPCEVSVARNKVHVFEIKLVGYETAVRESYTTISTTGILDAVGGLVVFPLIGLLTPGAWQQTRDVYHVKLRKLGR